MTFKVDVETVDPVRRRLAVEVPAEEVAAEIERSYTQLARSAKVRGFRPGRVPRSVVERLFGDRVRTEALAKLVQQSYAEAIQARQIEAVGQPEIVTEQAEPGAALRYNATVEVKPDVVAAHYAGIQVARPLTPVTEADIEAFIEQLRQSLAQLRPITDRAHLETGDVATLDYTAHVDGRLVGRGESREVEIGANGFPREFDEHLRGALVGTEREFSVVYPPDHPTADLAGKTAQFRVQLRALSHKEMPSLDDEFAKDHGECSTLAELRQRVRQQLEADAARSADEAARDALLAELVKANDIPVPNAMVQRRTEALVQDVLHQWQQRRIGPRNEGEALARLREDLEPRARQQVKVALVLEAIARQEQISVNEAEVSERIAALAAASGSAADRVRAVYQDPAARQQLWTRMLQSRVVDVLMARARIATVERTSDVAAARESG